MDSNSEPGLFRSAWRFWSEHATRTNHLAATRELVGAFWGFLRDSTPSRLRQRYGDTDYDWDYHVNTTSAAVGWRQRLLGVFHSAYQPTEPALFHEMLDALAKLAQLNYRDFIFLDLGSGKGRTLLMASDYPFLRIIGVELLPSLNCIAQENLRQYRSNAQQCFTLESLCADATTYPLPGEPLVIYLFNPFPESGLRRLIASLEQNLCENPRPVYVLYHNPVLEHVLSEQAWLCRIGGTHQYSILRARCEELGGQGR